MRIRSKPVVAAAIVVTACLVCVALLPAHETWLQPIAFAVDAPAKQMASMTSGMGEHYPAMESPIEPQRIAASGVEIAGLRVALTARDTTATALSLEWTPPGEGVAAVWIELKARTLLLEDSLVDDYFDEVGASPALRKEWDDIPSPKQWRESYAKHAKAYVRVGSRTAARAYTANTGMAFEIVPSADPTLLRAGDTLRVQLMYQRQSMPRATIAVFVGGGAKPQFWKTDASGRAAIPLDRAGPLLLAAVNLRRAREPGLEWRSNFTTMTFAVRGR